MCIDITGHCNAQCHWCPNPIERKMNLPRGFMEPAFFEKVLDRLEDIKAITPEKTYIALFNWGEPALHKKFLNSQKFSQIVIIIGHLVPMHPFYLHYKIVIFHDYIMSYFRCLDSVRSHMIEFMDLILKRY
jgi:hypothetical protein